MTDVLTLIQVEKIPLPNGGVKSTETLRDVFASRRSVGMRETYQASIAGFKPELVFKLEDALDYNGETHAEYDGVRYRILRTFQPEGSTEFQIVLTREVNKNAGS